MMDIENIIELVHKYETATNINKRKEIFNKLLKNFKKKVFNSFSKFLVVNQYGQSHNKKKI